MTTLLTARDLHVRLGTSDILRGLCLDVAQGAHQLIMGPSGSGKSTLLALLARLRAPDTGEIAFRGQPYARWGRADRFRLTHLGLVFQDFHLLEALSVRDNLGIIQAAVTREKSLPDLRDLLEPLDLIDKLDTPVRVLSRGERQRVALARAFANAPALLLADEPTASLDPSRRDTSMAYLFALCAHLGTTAIVVTHDRDLAADSAFVGVQELREGLLVSQTRVANREG